MSRILVSLAILSAFLFYYLELRPVSPCTEPIFYRLGSIDTRFGISREELLSAAASAEDIWEKSISRDLFSYLDGGKPRKSRLVEINLIHDYRQEATEELSSLEGEVRQDEAVYRALEEEHRRLLSQYAEFESLYKVRLTDFEKQNSLYEEMVDDWNAGNRTDKKRFQELESERLALNDGLGEIKNLESSLNDFVDKINMSVARLNRLAEELNLNVEEYNTIGAMRGETFTGGLYTSDKTGERIDVFEFEDNEKLIRILAHEFGHALGFSHVGSVGAIMYEFNVGDGLALSASDLEAIKSLCKIN